MLVLRFMIIFVHVVWLSFGESFIFYLRMKVMLLFYVLGMKN